MAVNFINAEKVTKVYGTRTILDEVSIGLGAGDVIGVVGRNGDGKSTLLGVLTGQIEPDGGRVTQTGSVSVGTLDQVDEFSPNATVRDVIVGGEPDHVWAADSYRRSVVEHLLADIDLDADLGHLSGGERRRTALVRLMFGNDAGGQHDLLVLDEPTNHLDVEAVSWLAEHLRTLQERGVAMLVVSHDRWFLDAICNRVWEVHDGVVDAYDGGYAAYVLARAERGRQAAANEARRQNLVRKELAWLRRGAPARTSKPKFRIEEANRLIADVPPPRDKLELQKFAVTRLGKDVFDLLDVTYDLPERPTSDPDALRLAPLAQGSSDDSPRPLSERSESKRPLIERSESEREPRRLFNQVNWSIGPGDRIGIVGVNGAGKSTLLKLLTGELTPTRGRVKQGKTLRIGHLTQAVAELDESDRVLDSVNRLKQETKLATGREATASQLLEEFGFTGEKLITRIGELSGGERRRLQFLRLLMSEPNVLLLDEPTNDLDIDTLTVIEDYLDSWPGTLILVTHDRYFLERVCDVTYSLMGDGTCVLLPGGVDQYLEHRRKLQAGGTGSAGGRAAESEPEGEADGPAYSPAEIRQAKKDMARIESQLQKLATKMDKLHAEMADAAADYARLGALHEQLTALEAEHEELELAWLEAGEIADAG